MADLSMYLLDFLSVNQFIHEGNWEVSKDAKIFFHPLSTVQKRHCVYIWVAKKDNLFLPLYIGKSRNGVIHRMKQHIGGFREDKNGSVSGRRKRKILEKIIECNWTIQVHSRESQFEENIAKFSQGLFYFNSTKIHSIKLPNVSFFSLEEELLIQFFKENFPNLQLMNGLKDVDADPDEFLYKMNAL
jgi:hypothetical protein